MKAQIPSIRLEHILQIASPLDGAFLRLVLIGFVYSESHVYQVEDVVGVARSKAEWECGLHSYLYIVAMHVGMRSIHRIAVVVDSTYAGFAVEGEGETILQFQSQRRKKIYVRTNERSETCARTTHIVIALIAVNVAYHLHMATAVLVAHIAHGRESCVWMYYKLLRQRITARADCDVAHHSRHVATEILNGLRIVATCQQKCGLGR